MQSSRAKLSTNWEETEFEQEREKKTTEELH